MRKIHVPLCSIMLCINSPDIPSHQVWGYTDLPTGWTHFILHQGHQTLCGLNQQHTSLPTEVTVSFDIKPLFSNVLVQEEIEVILGKPSAHK